MAVDDDGPTPASPATPPRRRLRSHRITDSAHEELPIKTPPSRAKVIGASRGTGRGSGTGRTTVNVNGRGGSRRKPGRVIHLDNVPEEDFDAESVPLGPVANDIETEGRQADPTTSDEITSAEVYLGGNLDEVIEAYNQPLLSPEVEQELPETPGPDTHEVNDPESGSRMTAVRGQEGDGGVSELEDSDSNDSETPSRGRQKAGRISDADKTTIDVVFAKMGQEVELLSLNVGMKESVLRRLYVTIFSDKSLASVNGLAWGTIVTILDAFKNPAVQAPPPTSVDGVPYSALQEITSSFDRLDAHILRLAEDVKRTSESILRLWKKTYAIPRPQKNNFNTFQAMSKSVRQMSGEHNGLTPTAASISYSAQKKGGVLDAKIDVYRQVQALDNRCQTVQTREKFFHQTKASLVKLSDEAAEKGIETSFVITGSNALGDIGMQHFYETSGLEGMYQEYFKLTPDMVCGLARVYATEKIANPIISEAAAAVENVWTSKRYLVGPVAARPKRTNPNNTKLLQMASAAESLDPSPEKSVGGLGIVILPPAWIPINSKDTKNFIGEYMETICRTLSPSSGRNDGWPWKTVNSTLATAGYYGTGWPSSAIFPGEFAPGKNKTSDGNRDMGNSQRISFCREVRLRPLAFHRANREDLHKGKHPVWIGAAPRLTKEDAQTVKKSKSTQTDVSAWPIARARCLYASPNGFVPGFDHGPHFVIKTEEDRLAEAKEISDFYQVVEEEVKKRAAKDSTDAYKHPLGSTGPGTGHPAVPLLVPEKKKTKNPRREVPRLPDGGDDPFILHSQYDSKAPTSKATTPVGATSGAIPLNMNSPHNMGTAPEGGGQQAKEASQYASSFTSTQAPPSEATALIQTVTSIQAPSTQPTATALAPPTGTRQSVSPVSPAIVAPSISTPSDNILVSSGMVPFTFGAAVPPSVASSWAPRDSTELRYPWEANKPGTVTPSQVPTVQATEHPLSLRSNIEPILSQDAAESLPIPQSHPPGPSLSGPGIPPRRKRTLNDPVVAEKHAKRPRTVPSWEGDGAVAAHDISRDPTASPTPRIPLSKFENLTPLTTSTSVTPPAAPPALMAPTLQPCLSMPANPSSSSTILVDHSMIQAVFAHVFQNGLPSVGGMNIGGGMTMATGAYTGPSGFGGHGIGDSRSMSGGANIGYGMDIAGSTRNAGSGEPRGSDFGNARRGNGAGSSNIESGSHPKGVENHGVTFGRMHGGDGW